MAVTSSRPTRNANVFRSRAVGVEVIEWRTDRMAGRVDGVDEDTNLTCHRIHPIGERTRLERRHRSVHRRLPDTGVAAPC